MFREIGKRFKIRFTQFRNLVIGIGFQKRTIFESILGDTSRCRYPWSLHLLIFQFMPVDRFKKWMVKYIADTISLVAQTVCRFDNQNIFDQISSTLIFNVFWLIRNDKDSFEKLHFLLGIEWSLSDKHLKQNDCKGPTIDRKVVALGRNNFGCHIFECTAHGKCLVWGNLCEAKVYNATITIATNQHIFWFHIPMSDSAFV
mmetsp:Transcript_26722/g.34832  ORF Transcript_26722/g.34832 Transcript_26722/m.34832 type:complete len:201 (+) Transcript_26722:692-1294(+)